MVLKSKSLLIFSVVLVFVSMQNLYASGKSDALFMAVEKENPSDLKKEIRSKEAFINAVRGPESESVLIAALTADRETEVIADLLNSGADPKHSMKNGQTPLMSACKYTSYPEVVELILNKSAFFDSSKGKLILSEDKSGKNSFYYAKQNKHPEQITAVLSKYAVDPDLQEAEKQADEVDESKPANSSVEEDLTEPSSAEDTAKVAVVQEPEVTVETESPSQEVVSLAPAIAELNTATLAPAEKDEKTNPKEDQPIAEPRPPVSENAGKSYTKEYLFDYAETAEDQISLPNANDDGLHSYIADCDRRDLNGRTMLMKAAKNGDRVLISNLLYSGANINAADDDGWTPLMFAARYQKSDTVISQLISAGANPYRKNNYGVTALQLASGFSTAEVVKIILQTYTLADSAVRTAFIYAITSQTPPDVLELYFAKGLPVNALYNGKTPLMYAAETNRSTTTIQYLLSKGAAVSAKNNQGKKAFDFAKENKRLPHNEIYWSLNNSDSGAGIK